MLLLSGPAYRLLRVWLVNVKTGSLAKWAIGLVHQSFLIFLCNVIHRSCKVSQKSSLLALTAAFLSPDICSKTKGFPMLINNNKQKSTFSFTALESELPTHRAVVKIK